MTDKEIVDMAKDAEKRTGFGELIHSPISKGVNSAYGIGFIEGMVEYRNSLQKEPVSDDLREKATQLSQKYFPDEENIWARLNIEALKCKSACIEMILWFKSQKGEEV